jgi:hypothetical protein
MGRWDSAPGTPPGRRKSTHNVGTQGAEGRCATGEQVAAVEWQEDLDVVLTVTLGKGGRGCQIQTIHQGTPLSSPPQTPGQAGGVMASAPGTGW